ncbi:MAG: hypothetical protein ACO3DQ_10155 [Cephaloticoccus sp.]
MPETTRSAFIPHQHACSRRLRAAPRRFIRHTPERDFVGPGMIRRRDGTHPAVVISALVASSLTLGLVDLLHSRNGRKLSRVLADAALLTPWPLWLLVALC